MATATNIALSGHEKLAYAIGPLRLDTAVKVSQILNENHKKWDIYTNDMGFHNHVVHHLLSLYALGASPEEVQAAYDENVPTLRPAFPPYEPVIQELRTTTGFKKYLGDYTQYSNYLAYFEQEVEQKGADSVVAEYVFSNDERSNDLLARQFTGFGHSAIHLGYGLEYNQPAIIAEALAQACVHEGWGLDFFAAAEKAAERVKQSATDEVSLLDLYKETRQVIQKLGPAAASWGYYQNGFKYGIALVAKQDLLPVLSKYNVTTENLEEKLAESIDAAVYYNVTSQHPPHVPTLDFFYIHSVTLSVHFPSFLTHPALSPEARTRFLEWKVRWDLANYASRGAAPLLANELDDYVPKKSVKQWSDLTDRVNRFVDPEDGGHAVKTIRGIANGWALCKKLGKCYGLKNEEAWLKAGALCMDSFEDEGPLWVRGAGFDEAWKNVPLREKS